MTKNVGIQRGARWKTIAACAVAAWALTSASAFAEEKIIVGLITKTNANPFFAKMKEGAAAKANELGVDFRSFAGKYDGDNTGQVDAIEQLMSAGAKAILITPSDTKAIVPTIERARKAGILVIALDTPLDPPSAADATFATDNQKAGELIGAVGSKDAWRQGQGRPHRLCRRACRSAFSRSSARLRLLEGLWRRELGLEAIRTRDRQAGRRPSVGQGRGSARAAPRWRRCSRRIRASTSSTRSTSRPRRAPTAR